MHEHVVTASIAAPWGPIRLAATSRGLVAAEQLTSAEEFAARLQGRFRAAPIPSTNASPDDPAVAHLVRARAAFEAFAGGDLTALDGLPIDLEDRPAWDRLVLAAVRGIPPGATASYGEVARMIGKPGAARAVGSAVGRNPLGLVIPCHRVMRRRVVGWPAGRTGAEARAARAGGRSPARQPVNHRVTGR